MSSIRWVAAGLAAVLIVVASYIYYDDFKAQRGEEYTEFYVLAADGTTAIDTSVRVGDSLGLQIGVANHEGISRDYRLRVRLAGVESVSERTIRLGDRGVSESPLSIPIRAAGANLPLQIDLFVAAQESPYRSLVIYLDAASSP